jgi:hypothetical protein
MDADKARRAAARGEVTLVVTCDENCTVRGEGTLAVPGRDIGLDPDSGGLPAGGTGALHLDLSRAEAGRLRRLLRAHRKAIALVRLSATDAAGNQTTAERRVRQKP